MFAEYLDCKDAYLKGQNTSGIYTIKPDNQTSFQVYCDMDTDGGGWTMFQRRMDGFVNFNQTWNVCENGFGNLTGEYWLGLSYIHRLTASASQELRVDLEDFENNTAYALYENFTVAGAADQYRLQVSGYNGTAGDAMSSSSGYRFSTKDRDNDISGGLNCALHYKGPWWHWVCSWANLNAKYYFTPTVTSDSCGVTWFQWKNSWYSLKKANMKVRRK